MRLPVPAVVALALAVLPATALAHEGDPNYESRVGAITPRTAGLAVEVINRDDRFGLVNRSGETVVVEGYEEEPYARVRGDGTVEVNLNSKSHYLNEERFGQVAVPPGVDSGGRPRWRTVSRTGRFEWHDHRMHWMAEGRRPPQVTDESVRTKVFDYRVPIRVGDRSGAIAGTLFWVPTPGGGVPLGAIVALAAVVIALCVAVIAVRRRRDGRGDGDREGAAEAW